MAPKEICAGGDVFSLGEPPADLSLKEAIQKFVTDNRGGTNREFDMAAMLFSNREIVVMMKF